MTSTTYPPTAVSLIGVPTDIGASVRGASMGPEAMRVAGLQQALERLGLAVWDTGNLHGPINPWQGPLDRFRHLPETVVWNQAVCDAVYAALQAGQLPIMLGGDHCLAIGSIGAVARHCRERGLRLRVLWLDAHADFNTAAMTPSGNIHGMPVACLCGHGPDALTRVNASLCTTWASRCSTCAPSTRSACATPWSRRWPGWTTTPTCT